MHVEEGKTQKASTYDVRRLHMYEDNKINGAVLHNRGILKMYLGMCRMIQGIKTSN